MRSPQASLIALVLAATVAAGLVSGCGDSSPSTPTTATKNASGAAEPANQRVCSGYFAPTDLVVVNFTNESSYPLNGDAWITRQQQNRYDRFTLPAKSAPATQRCSGGWSGGIDLKTGITWKRGEPDDLARQYLGFKNRNVGSDLVYCCSSGFNDSVSLSDPGNSTVFRTDDQGAELPFTTTIALESVRGGIPHFTVVFRDR